MLFKTLAATAAAATALFGIAFADAAAVLSAASDLKTVNLSEKSRGWHNGLRNSEGDCGPTSGRVYRSVILARTYDAITTAAAAGDAAATVEAARTHKATIEVNPLFESCWREMRRKARLYGVDDTIDAIIAAS